MTARLTFSQRGRDFDLTASSVWELSGALARLLRPDYWQRLAKNTGTSPGVIVDVGANIGAYSISFALAFPEARIIAIEPSGVNMAHLRHNTAQFPNIEPMQVAAHSQTGTVSLSRPTVSQRRQAAPDADKIATNNGILSLYGQGEVVETGVRAERLDDLVNEADWLKIDVEGNEGHVIDGARRLLGQHPLVMVEVQEINLNMAGETATGLGRKLNALGYVADRTDGNNVVFVWDHEHG